MCQTIHPSRGGRNLTVHLPPLLAIWVLLAFSITAGATLVEPEVDSISVSGSLPASLDEILEGTGLGTGMSLLRITPSEVQSGIVYNLKALGFLEPSVEVAWPSWDDPVSVVRLQVDTGRRSLLSGMVFEGASVLEADTLASLYPGLPGEPLTPSDTMDFRNAVLDLYAERGYIDTDIQVSLSAGGEPERGDGEVTDEYRALECTIIEGLQYTLGDVTVQGLETVRSKVVTRELMISPGDSLNMELLRQSISAIYQLGLFQDVRFTYAPETDDSLRMDLKIMLTESRYRRIDLGCGYTSPQAIFGSATWMHPNIMGNNQRLTIGMYYLTYVGSEDGMRAEPEITYEEPWFLSTRWWWQQKLGYLSLDIPGLEQKSWSATSSFARSLTSNLSLTTAYSLEYERYAETGDDSTGVVSDWVTTSSITASLVHDTRSPVLNPRRGHWFMAGGKLSGGFLGGRDFYRAVGDARFYMPVGSKLTLAGRIRAGAAFPYGEDSSVPPDDRFFLGGGTTVRGYALNSIGPKDDDGNYIGGRMELLGNFEVRMNIVGEFGVVLFTDGGGLWNTLADIDLDTSGFGTGFGLRYNTVFGPLRLDYGFAPTWSNALRRGKVYIGIGQIF